MLKKIVTYLVIELFLFGLVLTLTKSSLIFNLSSTRDLTPELIKKTGSLSYDQNYKIDYKMRYLIPVVSEDGKREASLIWPHEPFEKFLILVPYQDKALKQQTRFEGQLVRCIHRCFPSEMLIEMFSFVETLEKKFPNYKSKYTKLPSIIINTTVKPMGLKVYLNKTHYYWMGFGLCLIIGGLLLIKSILFGS